MNSRNHSKRATSIYEIRYSVHKYAQNTQQFNIAWFSIATLYNSCTHWHGNIKKHISNKTYYYYYYFSYK